MSANPQRVFLETTNTGLAVNEPFQSTISSTNDSRGIVAPRINASLPQGNIADGQERSFDTTGDSSPPLFTSSVRPTVVINQAPTPQVTLLAEWNGCVTSVQREGYSFSATLTGIVGDGVMGEEEDATIPIADVSEWDQDLLRPGNFFRLCVIHEVLPTGQPRRSTQVIFRRLPAYRKHDLEKAAERGAQLARGLRVE